MGQISNFLYIYMSTHVDIRRVRQNSALITRIKILYWKHLLILGHDATASSNASTFQSRAGAQKPITAIKANRHTAVSTPAFFALSSPLTPATFDTTRTTDDDDLELAVWSNSDCKFVPTAAHRVHCQYFIPKLTSIVIHSCHSDVQYSQQRGNFSVTD